MMLKQVLTFFLFNLLIGDIICQTIQIDSIIDLRDSALLSCRFKDYYTHQLALEDFYLEIKDFFVLESTSDDYHFLPCSAEDSFLFRKHLMYHGYMLRRQLGNVSKATAFYEKSHEYLSNKSKLDELAWYTEKELANLYAQLNDYDRAIYFSKLVESRLMIQGEEGKLGRLYSDLGDLYKWKGEDDKAIKYYKHGLQMGERSENAKAINANQQALARLYIEKKKAKEFNDHYSEVLISLDRVVRNDTYYYRLAEVKLLFADYLRMLQKYEDEKLTLLEIIPVYRKHYKGNVVREIAKIYSRLALNALERDNLEEADEYCVLGMDWLIPNKSTFSYDEFSSKLENTFYDLATVESEIFYRRYKKEGLLIYLDSAIISIDKALKLNEMMHNELSVVGSKLVSLEYDHNLLSKKLDLLYEGQVIMEDYILMEQINDCFLKSKYRLLAEEDGFKKRMKLYSSAVSDSIKSKETRLIQLYGQRGKIERGGNNDVDLMIYQIEKRLAALNKIGAKKFTMQVYGGPFIEYFWGEQYLYRLTNLSDKLVLDRIGETSVVKEKLDLLIIELRDPMNKMPKDLLSSMSGMLLKDITVLPFEVVIIPDGKLCLLPFDLLSFSGRRLLNFKSYSLRFSRFEREGRAMEYNRILIVAPQYDQSMVSSLSKNNLGPLHYVSNEINKINDAGFEAVTVEHSFDLQSGKIKDEQFDVLHFAGHANGEGDSQGLWMNSENQSIDLLTREQIARSNFDFGLVTLSACETGFGKFAQGEGIQSLAYSFLHSGVGAVLFTLWEVNDKTTSRIIGEFYKNLQIGLKPEVALNQAKMEFLAKATPEERHPFYWAGFVLTSIESDLGRESKSLKYTIIVLLCIFILIFYYIMNTKYK